MRSRTIVLIVGICIAAGLAFSSLALASHGGYHLDWWTADGGGVSSVESADGTYALSGTAGQPDAGTLESNDGSYTLSGGFWVGGAASGGQNDVYVPLVIK